jgi:hypothetical protein
VVLIILQKSYEMFTLPFEYNSKKYSALVHVKASKIGKEYRLTIMDGDLESLLYGNHVLTERDGVLFPLHTPNAQNEQLVTELINSLSQYLLYTAVL